MTAVTVVVVEFTAVWSLGSRAPGDARRQREPSLAARFLRWQVAVVLVLVATSLTLAVVDARREARSAAADRALSVARAVADAPQVITAAQQPDPTPELQPYAESVRRDADVDFVVVMSLDRVRWTHPDPAQIGGRFVGDVGTAPAGGVLTQEYTGTLGPSVRAVVPVTAPSGEVVALVSVGIRVAAIDDRLRADLLLIAVAAAAVLAMGLLGAWLVARQVRRRTHGLGEAEITRMYEYYSAVLHAVREGLLLLDGEGRVQLANEEARRLLALPADVVGRPLDSLGLAPALVDAARGRTAGSDLYLAGERTLLVSSAPASWQGRAVGAVVTVRDRTELQQVTGELDVVRGLTDSLRAQAHESANRLHTVVSLIETGHPEEAVDFATEELQLAQLLTDRVVAAAEEPTVAALLLGKSAQAAERGVDLVLTGDLPADPGVPPRDLVTVLGNLVDNALEALTDTAPDTAPDTATATVGAAGRGRRIRLGLRADSERLLVVCDDSGPGLSAEAAAHALERGWSTRGGDSGPGARGLGLALVNQVARRHGGRVAVGRGDLGGARIEVELRRGTP